MGPLPASPSGAEVVPDRHLGIPDPAMTTEGCNLGIIGLRWAFECGMGSFDDDAKTPFTAAWRRNQPGQKIVLGGVGRGAPSLAATR